MTKSENYYDLVSYLKVLCHVYFIARKNVNRLEKDIAKGKKVVDDISFWMTEIVRIRVDISRTIDVLYKNNYKVVVTSEEQVIAFIGAHDSPFSCHANFYGVISTDEVDLVDFPKQKEYCKQFLEAYKKKSDKLMKRIKIEW